MNILSQDLQSLANGYESWLSAQKLAARSRRVYISNLRQLVLFAAQENLTHGSFGERELHDLLLRFFENRHKTAQSFNAALPAANSFLRYLGFPALRGLGLRTGTRRPERVTLDDAAYQSYLEQVRKLSTLRNQIILRLIAECGLGISEVLELRIGDLFDIELHMVLSVPGRQAREVFLPADLSSSLRVFLCQRTDSRESNPLFVTRTGRKMDAQSVDMLLRSVGARIGLSVCASVLRRKATSRLGLPKLGKGNCLSNSDSFQDSVNSGLPALLISPPVCSHNLY